MHEVASIRANAAEEAVLFVAVVTAPDRKERREEIRSSWFQHELLKPGGMVKARFIIGETENANATSSLQTGEDHYADILRVPVMEGVGNLVNKTAALFQWFVKARPATYLLKIDDDTFPDFPMLLEQLAMQAPGYVYGGLMVDRCPPFRQVKIPDHRAFQAGVLHWDWQNFSSNTPNAALYGEDGPPFCDCGYQCGHWSEANDFYAPALYPRYALGSSYLLSGDLVRAIASYLQVSSRQCQSCYEDVSVGIWMRRIDVDQESIVILPWNGTVHGCADGAGSMFRQNLQLGMQKCMWDKLVDGRSNICCLSDEPWDNKVFFHNGTHDCSKQVYRNWHFQ
jgi:hypothetical protein